MFLNTIFIIMAIYGLWFFIQGCQDLPADVRKNWAPQEIEDYTIQKDQERYFGQIILCIVSMYLMFLII